MGRGIRYLRHHRQWRIVCLARPLGHTFGFYYIDDEVMVLASERPVIQTALNVTTEAIHELQAGQAIMLDQSGKMRLAQVNKPQKLTPCSFERIYFHAEATGTFTSSANAWDNPWCRKYCKPSTTTWNEPCFPSFPIQPKWHFTACSKDWITT